jgi:Mce-associated membrane protein
MAKPTDTKTVFDRIVEQIEGEAADCPETSASDPDSQTRSPRDSAHGSSKGESTNEDCASEQPDEDTNDDRSEDVDLPSDTDRLPSARSRIRSILRRSVPVVLGLISVAALASSAFFGWQLKQRTDTAVAERAALETARNYAATLSSVDSNDVDKSFHQVLDGSTGEFKAMYSQASAQLRQLLVNNKAVSRGLVTDAAIKSATKTKAEVLLFLDQSITNAVNTEPRIDRLRMVMTMELVDGRWLLSKLEIE